MRYRRLSYRYAMVAETRPFWVMTQIWRSEGRAVMFGAGPWRPDADMCETRASIEVTVDLAGVAEDDIDIQLFDDALVVEGKRHLAPCDEGGVYHVAGIRQGSFRLELPLPSTVDAEGVEARYERGLVRIVLPKREASG